jgi:FAD/FMN-containing dehydrogenase
MKRREFLKISGGLSAQVMVGGSLLAVCRAEADTGLPIAALKAALDPKKDMVLIPVTKTSRQYDISFSKRTQLTPRVRVVSGSAAAVSTTILWALNNGLGFAIRSGGHSYEGFSQSPDLVIDVRGMKGIKLAKDKKSVAIGSGSSLGSVYDALASSHLAIPAGSCFPVGVAGHSLGGGFGLLGRPFGLACDSILSMEVVDASGKILIASEQENPELFWALRGGGNGSFGVVTNFNFRTSSVTMVAKFAITWTKPVTQAVKIVQAWQQWLENLPSSITGTLHLTKAKGGIDPGAYGRTVGAIRKQFESGTEASSKPGRHGKRTQHKNHDISPGGHDLRRRRAEPRFCLDEGKVRLCHRSHDRAGDLDAA